MKTRNRAANTVNPAHSLDLQLFNEEFIDPIDPEANIEQDPIEADPQQLPKEDLPAEEPPVEPTPAPEDITQTQAFARRLREETERAKQEARDSFIAEMYEGQLWNGRPITTEAELQQALYEQELQNAGAGDVDLNKLINEHPDVKAARLQREAQQRQQDRYAEWMELQEEYPDIGDFSKLPPEVYALKEQKGISLLDAYNRIHIKKVKIQTEQETIRKLNQNAQSSPGSVMDDGVVHKTKSVDEMTPEEFEAYRDEVRRRTRGE